ncbi:hypothetical protein K3X41_10840 [Aliiroseovarius crassostreae]|uniref:hypothetical protein n=1 Tax=Aliiroseovarius crassostreae TaxID=154981 RepID=UPI00220051AC|nr:hypothetical protein [Aliiroseovarius crassostreae]UWQ07293.1 hypothetical protein K3X25_10960 [Aliiroseovarius crassostreae]UWQ10403.1 hypothetical protein K3X41_10840 [Aliiroseovarius crassostreae]
MTRHLRKERHLVNEKRLRAISSRPLPGLTGCAELEIDDGLSLFGCEPSGVKKLTGKILSYGLKSPIAFKRKVA